MAVSGNPGRGALIVSLVLAVGSGLAILFVIKPKVDDRGDPVAPVFGGLYIRAREALTGGPIKTSETSMLDAHGTAVLIWALLPAIVAVGAFVVYRIRKGREQSVYWPLTISMVLMALAVMTGASYAMPAMVAMAVASFQVRKAEMPARMAERAAAGGDVIEAEAEEDDDEYDDDVYEDEYDDEEYEDGDEVDGDEDAEGEDEVIEVEAVGVDDDDEADEDPLAALEEEIAQEDAASEETPARKPRRGK